MGPDLSMCFQGDIIIFTASIWIVAEILEFWGLPRYLIQKLTASGSLKERKAIQPLLKLGQKKSKRMHSKAAHDNKAQNQLSKTGKGT